MSELTEQTIRAGLADRGAQISPEAVARLQSINYHPRTRRFSRTLTVSSGLAVAVAVIALLVVATSSGPSTIGPAPAFTPGTGAGPSVELASWTTTPTTPTPQQLAAATKACNKTWHSGTAVMTGTPVLTEQRKAYTAAIYVTTNVNDNPIAYICMSNGKHGGLVSSGTWPFTIYGPPGPNQLQYPNNSGGGPLPGFGQAPAGADYGGLSHHHPVIVLPNGTRRPVGGGDDVRIATGLAGQNIKAVSFTFANKVTVNATVQNGWYFAWWPGNAYPLHATVTYSDGTTVTSPMPGSKSCNPTAHTCGVFGS